MASDSPVFEAPHPGHGAFSLHQQSAMHGPPILQKLSRTLQSSRSDQRVPPAHRAHRANCIIAVSWVLHHAAEHSLKTSKWSNVVTCSAHAHQGSQMQPNSHTLVHSVHRAHRAGGTLSAMQAKPARAKAGA